MNKEYIHTLIKIKIIIDTTNRYEGKIQLTNDIGKGHAALKTVVIDNKGNVDFYCMSMHQKTTLYLLAGNILDLIYSAIQNGCYDRYVDKNKIISFITNKVKEEQGHIGLVNKICNITITDIFEDGSIKFLIGNTRFDVFI